MDSERDISVEETYWDVPSVEKPAEMKENRMGQRKKSFDAVVTVVSALKLEWPLEEV